MSDAEPPAPGLLVVLLQGEDEMEEGEEMDGVVHAPLVAEEGLLREEEGCPRRT